jgi:hypothetical protein
MSRRGEDAFLRAVHPRAKCVILFGLSSGKYWNAERGLRHELSSPALTLRSWVRIPLETWMFCVR